MIGFLFRNRRNALIGVVLTLVCSLMAQSLSSLPALSVIGHLVLALLLGMLIQLYQPIAMAARESTGFIANVFLRTGIILLGFKLNLILLLSVGLESLEAAIFVVLLMIPINYIMARIFHVDHTLALLTACGCSICGAAAVMGVSGTLKAKVDQSVLAVAIVAILGTIFTLIEVFLEPFLGFTANQFGIMAGLSLHEIAHAVAAGGSMGTAGTDSAVIAKLSRVLLLAPVTILLGCLEAWRTRRKSGESSESIRVPIPWFMGGFIVASAIGSYVPAVEVAIPILVKMAYLILGMAMAALGVNVNFTVIAKKGLRPMGIAFVCSWILLGMSWYIVKNMF